MHSKMVCSKCKQVGHNKSNKSCPQYILADSLPVKKSKSDGLSTRHIKMNDDGIHLNDDSKKSEKTLCDAVGEIINYATKKFKIIGGVIKHIKSISLYECQEYFHRAGGPMPDIKNKKVCMIPDGGILILSLGDKRIPILIVEDKVQGTNDTRLQCNKSKQSTGNAIERGGKNIRGAEMLFSSLDIFPYALFSSGCDLHSSETISKRIEMMNFGIPNHHIDITRESTLESIDKKIETIISDIKIKKIVGKSIVSSFVKAHKWDEMIHGSSLWKKDEIVRICSVIIDQVFEYISTSWIQDT